MAEIEFVLTNAEQNRLLQYLESLETVFVPDIFYTEPKFQYLHDAYKAMSVWREGNAKEGSGPIFLLWDEIGTYELQYDELTKNGEKKYFPSQKEGGPYIDYLPCKFLAEETIITTGFIAYYPKYWIEELDDNITVPEEIKAKYKEISKFIRSISTRLAVKNFRRYYWVGNDALKLLQQGKITNSLDIDLPKKS